MHVTCDQINVRTPFNVYHKAHVNTINFHVHVTWNQIEPIYSFKVDQFNYKSTENSSLNCELTVDKIKRTVDTSTTSLSPC